MAELIQISQALKTFQSRTGPVHALGPLDLTVNGGEFISIVGPSGCGKSTLLLMVAGLLDFDSGEIKVEGSRVTSPQTDIGIVFQTPVLVDWRDVLGNVLLQIEMRKLNQRLPGTRPGAARLGRLEGICPPLSVRIFRRHATAHRLLPRPDP